MLPEGHRANMGSEGAEVCAKARRKRPALVGQSSGLLSAPDASPETALLQRLSGLMLGSRE
eukprot:411711-Alexandrium_andersonii.AAC.1